MDRNIISKVYINPNFKKKSVTSLISASGIPPSTYENSSTSRDYIPETQNVYSKINNHKNPSRKIYLNPNFKQIKETQNLPKAPCMYNQKVENTEVCSVSSANFKFSHITYLPEKKLENVRTLSHSHTQNTMNKMPFTGSQNSITQNVLINSNPKGVPIVKSRYCIVRKNICPEIVAETASKVVGDIHEKNCLATSHSNNNLAQNIHKNNDQRKPVEKIMKIRLNKYKTVPIAYLKKSHLPINQKKEYDLNKGAVKVIKRNNIQHSVSVIANKSRYKFTRSKTKTVELNKTTTPSKLSQTTNKKVAWQNQNKIKLNKENFKLNNIPCRLFTKYGKCLRKEYGNCEYLHDRKHVSLCRKFIKGICHDSNCSLSHELSSNKMPTCYFYLKGMCIKEKCPYLHVKLNDEIKICQNFVKGYCENGDQCTFRHVKLKECKKVKRSNLTSNTSKSLQPKSNKLKKIKSKLDTSKKRSPQKDKNNTITQSKDELRYYDDTCGDDICENIKPTRCKLGTLPSFIQL